MCNDPGSFFFQNCEDIIVRKATATMFSCSRLPHQVLQQLDPTPQISSEDVLCSIASQQSQHPHRYLLPNYLPSTLSNQTLPPIHQLIKLVHQNLYSPSKITSVRLNEFNPCIAAPNLFRRYSFPGTSKYSNILNRLLTWQNAESLGSCDFESWGSRMMFCR